MIKKLKNAWKKFKYSLSKDRCYDEMEKKGEAIFNCCCGMTGGDSSTNYLNYDCINCKYLTLIKQKY